MNDYKKIEQSHYLSAYQVMVPNWHGKNNIFTPFSYWANDNPLPWYRTYNETKHDRHQNFMKANFSCLIESFAGLSALIASQFWTREFSPTDDLLSVMPSGPDDGFESSIGGFFRIKFPEKIPDEFRYDFQVTNKDFDQDIFDNFIYK